MPDDTIPVTSAIATRALRRIRQAFPATVRLMAIGGTALQRSHLRPDSSTKDVDLVAVTMAPPNAVPGADEIAAWLALACRDVRIRKDRTSVSGQLPLEEGLVLIEVIRGRRAAGGYFVSRRALRAVAAMSKEEDGIWMPPLEAIAFLKAWAAHDQEKLVRSGRDRNGVHAARRDVFADDTRAILQAMLADAREPRGDILLRLIDMAGARRQKAMRRILDQAGWQPVLARAERDA